MKFRLMENFDGETRYGLSAWTREEAIQLCREMRRAGLRAWIAPF